LILPTVGRWLVAPCGVPIFFSAAQFCKLARGRADGRVWSQAGSAGGACLHRSSYAPMRQGQLFTSRSTPSSTVCLAGRIPTTPGRLHRQSPGSPFLRRFKRLRITVKSAKPLTLAVPSPSNFSGSTSRKSSEVSILSPTLAAQAQSVHVRNIFKAAA